MVLPSADRSMSPVDVPPPRPVDGTAITVPAAGQGGDGRTDARWRDGLGDRLSAAYTARLGLDGRTGPEPDAVEETQAPTDADAWTSWAMTRGAQQLKDGHGGS